jgi:hypothetical protein
LLSTWVGCAARPSTRVSVVAARVPQASPECRLSEEESGVEGPSVALAERASARKGTRTGWLFWKLASGAGRRVQICFLAVLVQKQTVGSVFALTVSPCIVGRYVLREYRKQSRQ